jgi:nitronate monooxygenase
MRDAATRENNMAAIQGWAGQSAKMARPEAAGDIVRLMWENTQALLP